MHNGDRDSRRVRIGENLFQLLAKLRDGLRRLGRVILLVLSQAGDCRQAENEHEEEGLNTHSQKALSHSRSPGMAVVVRR
jgi:hypothetical protein